MNLVVDRCIQEVRYRASTLRDFEGKPQTPLSNFTSQSILGRMSEKDVSLYANDVAGLLGNQLAAVEAAIKIFMNDGARNKSSQYLSHTALLRSPRYPVCVNHQAPYSI
jgi:hypothetical protein